MLNDLLDDEAKKRVAQSIALQDICNKICQHCPPGYVISLCMEGGAAWVQLGEAWAGFVDLPDAADKSLIEQLNDALCVANGWSSNARNQRGA